MSKMKVTAKELAGIQNIDGLMANTVLRWLELQGVAKIVDHRKSSAGRGRSSAVFELSEKIGSINMKERLADRPAKDEKSAEPAASEPADESASDTVAESAVEPAAESAAESAESAAPAVEPAAE